MPGYATLDVMFLCVRKASKSDIDAIQAILNDALDQKQQRGDQAWGEDAFSKDEVCQLLEDGTVILAEVNGEPVACGQYIMKEETAWGAKGKDEQALYLHRLAKKKVNNIPRIAETLVQYVANEARALNRPYLRLDCPGSNLNLCAYYESLGFTRVDTTGASGRALFEQTIDRA